ncbi:hypothetical protein BD310DRAFT_938966 [Dichomitus squalens]|uniref:Uncharacterized protein n=1 Tax=Dichomitus squalens TaxID=114155 RepID=A0A4Q9PDP5_9APHY|nr:hypothetical protein BD310DRAFT_938966 [Dichomitus squalens]
MADRRRPFPLLASYGPPHIARPCLYGSASRRTCLNCSMTRSRTSALSPSSYIWFSKPCFCCTGPWRVPMPLLMDIPYLSFSLTFVDALSWLHRPAGRLPYVPTLPRLRVEVFARPTTFARES